MSTVRKVKITCSEEKPAQFMMGALFTRICAEATALEVVVMKEGCFSIMAPLVPVNLKYLSCDLYNFKPPHIYVGGERNHADLALLARLTQLKNMTLNWLPTPPTQPLPQLPALLSLRLHMHRHMWTEVLQTMSSVAATLQELHLHANCFDFRQPGTLTRFTRLHTLSVQTYEEADRICNFSPAVLPPTLCSITISHGQRFQRLSDLARHRPEVHAVFDFPAGGHIVNSMGTMREYVVRWTRHLPL